jgi:hypothetical protein
MATVNATSAPKVDTVVIIIFPVVGVPANLTPALRFSLRENNKKTGQKGRKIVG